MANFIIYTEYWLSYLLLPILYIIQGCYFYCKHGSPGFRSYHRGLCMGLRLKSRLYKAFVDENKRRVQRILLFMKIKAQKINMEEFKRRFNEDQDT